MRKYNRTIHSVIGERPIDVKIYPTNYPNISNKILAHQKMTLEYHNKNRQNRNFSPNEIIYVKSNRRRKDASAYTKHIVMEDLGDSVRTTRNKVFHKDSIRINRN